MKKLWISIMSLLLILVSCAPKEQAPQEKAVEVITDDLTDPILPDCDMGMNRPEIISPKQEIIDASPPHTFSWNIGCVPDQYHILVYPNEDNIVPVISEYFSPDGKEYTSNVQFDPVTTYIWTISAFIEPHPAPKVSLQGSFSTGPVCSGQDLVPPTLVSPADGSIDGGKGWGYLEEVQTTIKYPAWHLEPFQQFGDGCTPEYFEIDLSVNPDFSGPDPWNLGGQSHFGTIEDGWRVFRNETSVLLDCTFYYWRARAEAGGNFSDWSEIFSFYTDFYDSCFFVPEFRGLKNANCRTGPWVGENYSGIIREGETTILLGLNEDASWGKFKLENELECWVNMSLLEFQPPGAHFNPAFYPILEHTEKPKDIPIPAEEPPSAPAEELPSGGASPQGCIAPDASGAFVCQIPCPDPRYAEKVCP